MSLVSPDGQAALLFFIPFSAFSTSCSVISYKGLSTASSTSNLLSFSPFRSTSKYSLHLPQTTVASILIRGSGIEWFRLSLHNPFGKNTHIRRIHKSVAHLWSCPNSTMALLEFFFQKQSYWTVQLGQSLELDHSMWCLSGWPLSFPVTPTSVAAT